MSNRNFICFNCRVAMRRSSDIKKLVICSKCGNECINIGCKIPVPAKNKLRKWAELKNQFSQDRIEQGTSHLYQDVQATHEIHKKISKLSSLPYNSGRKALIEKLFKKL